ncbi:EAL domain-containing protein, partial [Rhizobium leguminosarum]|uniref:EAL domain-containing protein n=1 Tax=Rhizobium leguminosarum TaxID=384 RepID=UPI003F95963E
YQPILRLDTREILGFEALCRMTTPSGEIIASAHFHEATKDAHIAAELTQRMLLRVERNLRFPENSAKPVLQITATKI